MIFGVTFCFSTKNSKEQFENYCSIKSLAQFLLSVLFSFARCKQNALGLGEGQNL